VSVFSVVGCGHEIAMLGIDYERRQQPNISPPRRVCRNGGSVHDGGFRASVACEGVWVGASGHQASQVQQVHRPHAATIATAGSAIRGARDWCVGEPFHSEVQHER
jgi:hypothetical protein